MVVVNKEDFEVCGQKNVINMYYNGPTILNLTATGNYYYYCGIGKHCEVGQKLHIKVVKGEGSSGTPFVLNVLHTLDTSTAPAPALTIPSSATNIQNFGMVSGLVAFLFSILFV